MPASEIAIKIGVYYEHLTQEKVADKIGELTRDHGWSVEKIAIAMSDLPFDLGKAAAASDSDVVIVTLGGRESVNFFNGFRTAVGERRGKPRPLTISMAVGLVLDRAFYGTYSFRDGADVVLLNRQADIPKLEHLFAAYTSRGPKILACRCPIFANLPLAPDRTSAGAPKKILFAVQTDVPGAEAEREYIIDEFIALADSNSQLEIKIKPKHKLNENSAHPQKFPYEEILSIRKEKRRLHKIVVDYGDMAALIEDSDVVVSISSTALIEALSYGKRAAVIADLGVRENLGNTYFLRSGLLTTFERLKAGVWPSCDDAWLSEELGAPQLPEVIVGLSSDIREAREGRLGFQESIFNARSSRSLAPSRPKAASFPVSRNLSDSRTRSIASLLDEWGCSPLEAGRAAFARGDYHGAIAIADYALEKTPSSSLNMQLAAVAYEQLGLFDEASKFIANALKSRPGDKNYMKDYYRIKIKKGFSLVGGRIGGVSGIRKIWLQRNRMNITVPRSELAWRESGMSEGSQAADLIMSGDPTSALSKIVPLLQWAAVAQQSEWRIKPKNLSDADWLTLARKIGVLARDVTATFEMLTREPEETLAPLANSERARLFGRLLRCAESARLVGAKTHARQMLDYLLAVNPRSKAANWCMARVLPRPAESEAVALHLRRYLESEEPLKNEARLLLQEVEDEISLRQEQAQLIRAAATKLVPPQDAAPLNALEAWGLAIADMNRKNFTSSARHCAEAVHKFSDEQLLALSETIIRIFWEGGEGEMALQAQSKAVKLRAQAKFGSEKPLKPAPFFSIHDLRSYVFGKRVCLVANSGALLGSSMGDWIDSHDVVCRFNSFKIEPDDTGARTDIHAAIHKHSFNLNTPCHARIIFSGDPKAWKVFIRDQIVPSAQSFVGDSTLRWPVRDPNIIGDKSGLGIPTSGFNLLRVLMFLGTCSEINLVGFDFYEGGILRLDEALSVPLAGIHNTMDEKDWVLKRTARAHGIIKSMNLSSGVGQTNPVEVVVDRDADLVEAQFESDVPRNILMLVNK